MDGQTRGWPVPIDGLVGKLKEAAVYGISEYLVHIAQVEGGGLERFISKHSQAAHVYCIDEHEDDQQPPGDTLLIANMQQFHSKPL